MTTDDLSALGLDGLGSQFTTYYDQTNTPRAQNIMQAAKLVDGTIIKPGTVFSLNDTLGRGPWTAASTTPPLSRTASCAWAWGVGLASS